MSYPKIKEMNKKNIIQEIITKIPFFVPEWKPGDGDGGLALIKIFSEMYLSMLERLNQSPLKHYLTFLEMLNIKPLPPRPAEVPIVFVPSEGVTDDIMVPVFTKVAGKDDKEKPIIFETKKTFVVTPSRLKAIFSYNPETDTIYNHSSLIDGKKSTQIFAGSNLQSHILYIGDSELFNIKNGMIVLELNQGVEILGNSKIVSWEYIPDGKEINEWTGNFEIKVKNNLINLIKVKDDGIKETEINGIKSRWIRCRLKGQSKKIIHRIKNLRIDSIKINVELIPKIERRIPVKNVHGIGSKFQLSLHEKAIYFVDQIIHMSAKDIAELLKIPIHRAENILEAAKKAFYDKTGIISIEIIKKGIPPDIVFVNDIPVNVKDFYIFGLKPKPYDTCYIGSEEVFSKKGSTVSLEFELYPGQGDNPQLSWEYWDGNGWNRLEVNDNLVSDNKKFLNKEITIKNLPDIKKTIVNGKENYWIRIRLVGGDYGKEYNIKNGVIEKGNFQPPRIINLKLSYTSEKFKVPQHIVTENNLCINSEKTPFFPFVFFDDPPTLYFSLDMPLNTGPYSIFFDIDNYYYYPDDERPPNLKWQFYSKNGWKDLNILDETNGLTRAGNLLLSLEDEIRPLRLFGMENSYWIRAIIKETSWELKDLSELNSYIPLEPLSDVKLSPHIYVIASRLRKNKHIVPEETLKECEEMTFIIKDLAKLNLKLLPPVINGIYLNTIMSIQSESIEDEILGSGTGEMGLRLHTTYAPVVEETLWIDEINAVSEQERKELRKKFNEIREEYDDKGNLLHFWIKWSAVESFAKSLPSDRHYIIDRVSGEIIFGDGKNGKIPPPGINNIKIYYRTGGGKRGNLPSEKIKELHSSIPYIESIYNPISSSGGCDSESIEDLIERGSKILRHRSKAVSVKDYYELTIEASRSISRVKVIPGLDDTLEPAIGHITIVIVLHSEEERPLSTPVLKKQIKDYIKERASPLVSIHVIDPVYVKVNLDIVLTGERIDLIPLIQKEIREGLKKFLHPLKGGKDEKGWDFGVIPCKSDLYAMIQKIKGVLYVNDLKITLEADGKNYPVSGERNFLPRYCLIYPGEINLKINLKKE